jgi:DNA mismatch repair protein PMS2
MSKVQIRAIDRKDVHNICSGQVIVDLATAVKELVENSLDAGATHVEVRLKDYGLGSFEVTDDGSGVDSSNYEALTLKHHTSKLSEFSDLDKTASFGFRGEALSSLCGISGSLVVTTRVKDQAVGAQLEFDKTGALFVNVLAPCLTLLVPTGKLVNQTPVARPVGTTVTVCDLFKPLPVRHGDFKRTIKRHYTRLLRVIQVCLYF